MGTLVEYTSLITITLMSSFQTAGILVALASN